ncbi:MAG TPA: hypothetical protein VNM72_11075 [Blastocatellia bacterium]|nr:hypothetical protein [Blastocatellia bacterium]
MTEAAQTDRIVAVSNTGPLISAFQSGRTDLLRRYFSVIYIPASELNELDEHGWANEIRELINDGLVKVVELTEQEKELAEHLAKRIAAESRDRDWRNHLPEAEAMALMEERKSLAKQILLDEMAARNVAQERNLSVTGFPGVVDRAKVDGLLTPDQARQLLKTCQQQGTHYSDELIETVARSC